MDTIEDRHAELAEMVQAALDSARQAYSAEQIMEKVRGLMRAILDQVYELGSTADAEMHAQINALGAPQRHREHAQPPQQEGI